MKSGNGGSILFEGQGCVQKRIYSVRCKIDPTNAWGAHSHITVSPDTFSPNIITQSSISACSGYSTCNYFISGLILQSYLNNSAHNCFRNCAYVLYSPNNASHTNFSTFWNNTAEERSLLHMYNNHYVKQCIVMMNSYTSIDNTGSGIINVQYGLLSVDKCIIINNTGPVLFGTRNDGQMFLTDCYLKDNVITDITSGAVSYTTTLSLSLNFSYYTTEYHPEVSRNTAAIVSDHKIDNECSNYDSPMSIINNIFIFYQFTTE